MCLSCGIELQDSSSWNFQACRHAYPQHQSVAVDLVGKARAVREIEGFRVRVFFELQGFLPACSVNSARCTLVSC